MSRAELIRVINYYQLDFRFHHWKEHLFMAEQGIYSDDFCDVLLDEAKLDGEKIENFGNYLWRPPTEDELNAEGKPDIEMGYLLESGQKRQRFGVRFIDRPRNCLVVGGAGSGKTVCGLNLCIKIDATNKYQTTPTVLIIICPKRDYGHLKNKLYLPVKLYSPAYGLKIGLNCPDNTIPYLWITRISTVFAARLGLISSRTTLTKIIASLLIMLNHGLKEEDLHKPTSGNLIWPPLRLVLKVAQDEKLLNAYSSKESYSLTLSHAIEGLLQDSGTLLECNNGFDIHHEILSPTPKHCIIDVHNIEETVVHIIIDIIIYQLLTKRLADGYKTDHTDVVLLFEEVELLKSDVKDFTDCLSPLDKLHRLGRELGLMSIINVSGI